jgi:aquaglyceroporin related protein, other eukaryote
VLLHPRREIIFPSASDGLAVCRSPMFLASLLSSVNHLGVSLGVWISGGVSGGHVNPVVWPFFLVSPLPTQNTITQVTLCMAIFRGFPWRKVPRYILAQLIGAWLGAMLVFANYFHAIDIVEGGKGKRSLATGSLFGTYAVRLP